MEKEEREALFVQMYLETVRHSTAAEHGFEVRAAAVLLQPLVDHGLGVAAKRLAAEAGGIDRLVLAPEDRVVLRAAVGKSRDRLGMGAKPCLRGAAAGVEEDLQPMPPACGQHMPESVLLGFPVLRGEPGHGRKKRIVLGQILLPRHPAAVFRAVGVVHHVQGVEPGRSDGGHVRIDVLVEIDTVPGKDERIAAQVVARPACHGAKLRTGRPLALRTLFLPARRRAKIRGQRHGVEYFRGAAGDQGVLQKMTTARARGFGHRIILPQLVGSIVRLGDRISFCCGTNLPVILSAAKNLRIPQKQRDSSLRSE